MTERDIRSPATVRRGGRPSRLRESQIRDQIVDVAADLFLTEGYGATSIGAIAKRAGISKRTFYHRFSNKADLFGAVVHRLVDRLRPPNDAQLFKGGTLEEILLRLSTIIVHATLTPEALALYRMIVAEAKRFPELAAVVDAQGSRSEAINRIANLLERESRAGTIDVQDAKFTAEQFIQMVVSTPQRRALGLGMPMTTTELNNWVRNAVTLFMNGCRVRHTPPTTLAPQQKNNHSS